MKIRHFALGVAILASAAILATCGAYLKFHVLKPLDIYQDKSVFELPFLMHSDEYLRFMVEHAEELKQMEQDASTAPTQPSGTTTPGEGTTSPKPTEPSASEPEQSTNSGTDPSSGATSDSTSGSTEDPSSGSSSDTTTLPPTSESPTTDSTTESTTKVPDTTAPTTSAGPNFDFPDGVSDDWFDNTLFIGDSRVVGLREYARSGNAEYFCDVGMNLLSCDDKVLSDKTFSNMTLEALLNSRQYEKIIVNFGLNECGFNDYSFKMLYQNLLNMLREKQPNAIIILQGIMSVTRSKANSASYFQPSFIAARSAFIQSLADGQTVFYIDCNEYFTDENGYLYSSITNDGYHPTVTGYKHWRNWIAFALKEIGFS